MKFSLREQPRRWVAAEIILGHSELAFVCILPRADVCGLCKDSDFNPRGTENFQAWHRRIMEKGFQMKAIQITPTQTSMQRRMENTNRESRLTTGRFPLCFTIRRSLVRLIGPISTSNIQASRYATIFSVRLKGLYFIIHAGLSCHSICILKIISEFDVGLPLPLDGSATPSTDTIVPILVPW
jgi:hypothetical protein